jgi:hypothetical protein
MRAAVPHPAIPTRTADVLMVPVSASRASAGRLSRRMIHPDVAAAGNTRFWRLHPINMTPSRQDII